MVIWILKAKSIQYNFFVCLFLAVFKVALGLLKKQQKPHMYYD